MKEARPILTVPCDICGSDVQRKALYEDRQVLCIRCYQKTRRDRTHRDKAEEELRQALVGSLEQVPRLLYVCERCGRGVVSDKVIRDRVFCSDHCSQVFNGTKIINEPREAPVNEWEELAVSMYAEKGFSCLWMPTLAPFDFVVNGHRVDVKGGEIAKRPGAARIAFELCSSTSSHRSDELDDRADVYHLIGRDTDGSTHHFLIPSADLNGRTQITIPTAPDNYSRWRWYEDLWLALQRGVPAAAVTAAAQAAKAEDKQRTADEIAANKQERKERRQAARAEARRNAKQVGHELRDARLAAGLRGTDLVPYMGCSYGFVYHLENGIVLSMDKWAPRYYAAIRQAQRKVAA